MQCRIGSVIAVVSAVGRGLVSSARAGSIDWMLDTMCCMVDSLVDCCMFSLCVCNFFICSNDFNILSHILSRCVRYLARARECSFACWLAGSSVTLSNVTGRGPLGVPSFVSALCCFVWMGESIVVDIAGATGVYWLTLAVADWSLLSI